MDFSKDLTVKQNSTLSSQMTSQFIFCPLTLNHSCSEGTLPSIHELGILSSEMTKSPISTEADSSPPLPAMGFSQPDKELLSGDQRSVRRRQISNLQKEELNKVFKQSFFPTTEVRAQLARDLGMSPRAVQIWFQNKRQAWRSKHKPGPVQMSSVFGSTSVPYTNSYSASHPYSSLSFIPSSQLIMYYPLNDSSQ